MICRGVAEAKETHGRIIDDVLPPLLHECNILRPNCLLSAHWLSSITQSLNHSVWGAFPRPIRYEQVPAIPFWMEASNENSLLFAKAPSPGLFTRLPAGGPFSNILKQFAYRTLPDFNSTLLHLLAFTKLKSRLTYPEPGKGTPKTALTSAQVLDILCLAYAIAGDTF